MTDELKPCPFCGSGDVEQMETDVGANHYYISIRCNECGAQSKQIYETDYLAQETIIKAWNTRYTPTENKGGDNPWRALDTLKRHKHPNHGGEFLYAPDVYNALSDRRPASPTKADKVEPLAVLADRKGCEYSVETPKVYGGWAIILYCNEDAERFDADTYAAAESKARAFLTALDDVTGKGGRV